MGGLGSGRLWGFGRPVVEDGLSLDVNKLLRDGNIQPGRWLSGTLIWRRVVHGDEVGSIGYEANLTDPNEAWIRLYYRVNDHAQDYRVALATTRPNYGGRRWWFLCPVDVRRAGKLHLPPGGTVFASRRAYGLVYRSQRERACDRAMTRAQDIRIQLGGDPSMIEPFPDKPSSMWWRTYWRLRGDAEASAYQFILGAAQRLGMEV